jgi:LysR family transcriptional regulator, benzoate and cis,cis-muconate-responsive activator of ben and cat genes
MELRHLRYFIAVAELQNITRAAAKLHVSQPPLSRQIRDLEDELGVALFEHGAKALRLTDAGRAFLPEARAALQRVDDAVHLAKVVGGGQRGEIHIGYAPSLAVELLPRALKYFHESSPGVRVRLYDLSTQEMLPGLVDGKLQVALLEWLAIKVTTGLAFVELQRYPFCLVVHPAHPLARVRKVGLEQVARERLLAVTLSDYPDYRAILDRVFEPLDRTPQIAEEFDSATSLIAALEGGRGVALVSKALNCFAGPRLKFRPVHPSPPPLIVGIAYRKSKHKHSKATTDFIAAAQRAGSRRHESRPKLHYP